MQAKRLDTILLLMMIALAIFAGFNFLRPISFDSRARGLSLAMVESGQNIVKVRALSSPFWFDAAPQTMLTHQDMVYTHDNSSASISLHGGGKIALGEKTLFRLDQNQLGLAALKLERGTIRAEIPHNGFEIRTGAKTTRVLGAGKQVILYQQDGEQLLSPVEDGVLVEVDDQSKATRSYQLQSNEQLILPEKKGSTVPQLVRQLKVTRSFPARNQQFTTVAPFSLTFDFSLDGDRSPQEATVEVSSNPSFKKLLPLTQRTCVFDQQGTYYWRVGLLQDNKWRWSNPMPFSIGFHRPPQLLAPTNGELVGRVRKGIGPVVTLSWRTFVQGKSTVTVVDQSGESDVQSSNDSMLLYQVKAPGNYSWQVRSETEQGALLSPWWHFSVAETLPTIPPSLLSPKNGASLSLFSNKGLGATLQWEAKSPFVSTTIDLFDAQGNKIDEVSVQGTSYFIPLQRFADYFWQVRSMDEEGVEFTSERFGFSLRYIVRNKLYPQKGVELQLDRPNQNVKFEWASHESSVRYLYELSSDSDFTNILLVREVVGNKLELSFPQLGTYFWRTKIIRADGQFSFSEPVKVQVSPTPPPSAPDLSPESIFEIKLRSGWLQINQPRLPLILHLWHAMLRSSNLWAQDQALNTAATLIWKKYSNAAFYKVQIFRDDQGKDMLLERMVREPQLDFDNPGEGTYFWRVAIIDHWGRQGPFSALSVLKLVLSSTLKPLTPAVLVGTNSPLYSPSALHFRWTGDPRAIHHIFELSANSSFLPVIYSQEITSQQLSLPSTVKLKRDKTYFWRVQSRDQIGRQVISSPLPFTIESPPAPIPSRASLVQVPTKPLVPLFSFTADLAYRSLRYQQQNLANNYSFDGNTFASADLKLDYWTKKLIYSLELEYWSGKVFEQRFTAYSLAPMLGLQLLSSADFDLSFAAGLFIRSMPRFAVPLAQSDDPRLEPADHFFLPKVAFALSLPLNRFRWVNAFDLATDLTTTEYALQSMMHYKLSAACEMLGGMAVERFKTSEQDDVQSLSLDSYSFLLGVRWSYLQ